MGLCKVSPRHFSADGLINKNVSWHFSEVSKQHIKKLYLLRILVKPTFTTLLSNQSTDSTGESIVSECSLGKWSGKGP